MIAIRPTRMLGVLGFATGLLGLVWLASDPAWADDADREREQFQQTLVDELLANGAHLVAAKQESMRAKGSAWAEKDVERLVTLKLSNGKEIQAGLGYSDGNHKGSVTHYSVLDPRKKGGQRNGSRYACLNDAMKRVDQAKLSVRWVNVGAPPRKFMKELPKNPLLSLSGQSKDGLFAVTLDLETGDCTTYGVPGGKNEKRLPAMAGPQGAAGTAGSAYDGKGCDGAIEGTGCAESVTP